MAGQESGVGMKLTRAQQEALDAYLKLPFPPTERYAHQLLNTARAWVSLQEAMPSATSIEFAMATNQTTICFQTMRASIHCARIRNFIQLCINAQPGPGRAWLLNIVLKMVQYEKDQLGKWQQILEKTRNAIAEAMTKAIKQTITQIIHDKENMEAMAVQQSISNKVHPGHQQSMKEADKKNMEAMTARQFILKNVHPWHQQSIEEADQKNMESLTIQQSMLKKVHCWYQQSIDAGGELGKLEKPENIKKRLLKMQFADSDTQQRSAASENYQDYRETKSTDFFHGWKITFPLCVVTCLELYDGVREMPRNPQAWLIQAAAQEAFNPERGPPLELLKFSDLLTPHTRKFLAGAQAQEQCEEANIERAFAAFAIGTFVTESDIINMQSPNTSSRPPPPSPVSLDFRGSSIMERLRRFGRGQTHLPAIYDPRGIPEGLFCTLSQDGHGHLLTKSSSEWDVIWKTKKCPRNVCHLQPTVSWKELVLGQSAVQWIAACLQIVIAELMQPLHNWRRSRVGLQEFIDNIQDSTTKRAVALMFRVVSMEIDTFDRPSIDGPQVPVKNKWEFVTQLQTLLSKVRDCSIPNVQKQQTQDCVNLLADVIKRWAGKQTEKGVMSELQLPETQLLVELTPEIQRLLLFACHLIQTFVVSRMTPLEEAKQLNGEKQLLKRAKLLASCTPMVRARLLSAMGKHTFFHSSNLPTYQSTHKHMRHYWDAIILALGEDAAVAKEYVLSPSSTRLEGETRFVELISNRCDMRTMYVVSAIWRAIEAAQSSEQPRMVIANQRTIWDQPTVRASILGAEKSALRDLMPIMMARLFLALTHDRNLDNPITLKNQALALSRMRPADLVGEQQHALPCDVFISTWFAVIIATVLHPSVLQHQHHKKWSRVVVQTAQRIMQKNFGVSAIQSAKRDQFACVCLLVVRALLRVHPIITTAFNTGGQFRQGIDRAFENLFREQQQQQGSNLASTNPLKISASLDKFMAQIVDCQNKQQKQAKQTNSVGAEAQSKTLQVIRTSVATMLGIGVLVEHKPANPNKFEVEEFYQFALVKHPHSRPEFKIFLDDHNQGSSCMFDRKNQRMAQIVAGSLIGAARTPESLPHDLLQHVERDCARMVACYF